MSFTRPQSEVGLYGATYKVLEILVQFPYLFLGIILPLLTKFFTINKNLFNLIFKKSFDLLVALAVPMIIASVILGEKIMVFVAGDEFIISGVILKILIFAAGLIFIGALFGYAIVACGLQKKMIKFYLLDALISIPLYLIFIPIYSYWAASILTILTEAIITISAYWVLKKNTDITIEYKVFSKAILAGTVMGIVLLALIKLHLLWLVAIGLIVYLWSFYTLKGIDKKTITEIIDIKKLR